MRGPPQLLFPAGELCGARDGLPSRLGVRPGAADESQRRERLRGFAYIVLDVRAVMRAGFHLLAPLFVGVR